MKTTTKVAVVVARAALMVAVDALEHAAKMHEDGSIIAHGDEEIEIAEDLLEAAGELHTYAGNVSNLILKI